MFMAFFTHKKNDLSFDLKKAYGQKNVIPVVIIGSGPAGLSAALYTARAKIKTVVFAGHEPGGTLNQVMHIENWPGKKKIKGSTLMHELEDQAKQFGAEIIYETINKVDLTKWPFTLISNEGTEVHAFTVIITTGGIAKKLEVPGVDEYWGKGIGSCAICDAPFNKDQDVVVVGGGDPAAEIALQVAAYAKKVTMCVEEKRLPACATVQDYLKAAKNIHILTSTRIDKILGDGTTLTSVSTTNTATDKKMLLPTKALYFGIGYKPISNIFKPSIETDKDGYIVLQGRSQKTSLPGIFAAGMVEDKVYGKAGIASGNGIKAALDAISFLESIGLTPYIAKKMEPQFFIAQKRKTSALKIIKYEQELKRLLRQSSIPVVIDFFAPYCPSCIHLMPVIERLAADNSKKIDFVKVDVDQSPDIAKSLAITAIPSFVVFEQGKEVSRFNQANTKESLLENLNKWLE